jgi:hypothetical protein
MKIFSVLLLFLFGTSLLAQKGFEQKLDNAYLYAKKGVYFALENIPEKKSKLEKVLINEDKIIAKVRLFKEVEGVKIESTGYFESNEVKVILYRSYQLLKKEGYSFNRL